MFGNREFWWQFGAYRTGMRHAIAPLRRVLVRAEVSQLHMIAFVPKDLIYSHMLIVFAFDDDYHFALLQSSVHEMWLRKRLPASEPTFATPPPKRPGADAVYRVAGGTEGAARPAFRVERTNRGEIEQCKLACLDSPCLRQLIFSFSTTRVSR